MSRRQLWWHSIRAYTVVEVRQLLERAGLRLEAVYGSLGGGPYSIESEDAVFVASWRQPARRCAARSWGRSAA